MGQQSVIPLIDFQPFLEGGQTEKQSVARKIGRVCEQIGFFLISGHQVSPSSVEAMRAVSRAYFALPLEEKFQLRMPPDRYRGYLPLGGQTAALTHGAETPPDLVEHFSIGPVDIPADAYHTSPQAGTYFAPNQWPTRPACLRSTWEAYYQAMERLAEALMQSFALALELPETYFNDKINKHITNFSALYYPAQREEPEPDQLRAGEHSDLGSLTILCPDSGAGGLQVYTREGRWVDVPLVEGTFVVNLGDLMAEWTNDRWVSTLHRVVNPPRSQARQDRLSLAFCHQPNYDADIECIETCCGPDNPPKYGHTTSGAHRTKKLSEGRYTDLRGKEAATM